MEKIKYSTIGIMIIIAINTYCQTSYLLTFSSTDKVSSANITLDSIYIKNETSGDDITITDTFLYLNLSTGISDMKWNDNTFSIYQNYENVIGGQSSFNVRLSSNSNLLITVYDITGKEICNYHGNYGKGIHTFSFEFTTNGIYIISANNGEEIKTFKAYNNGIGNANIDEIHFIGSEYNSFDPIKKAGGSIGFTNGDQMTYIGYSGDYENDTINDSPLDNKDYIFEFDYGMFTDARDSQKYKIVKIGNQTWMAENLAYLSSVNPPSQYSGYTPYYYVYDYEGWDVDSAKATINYQTYGVLYNWPAAMNGAGSSSSNPSEVQGVCPAGWHLPSDSEWKELEMYLGMSQSEADKTQYRGTTEGGKMKETDTLHWMSPNTGATNSSGFTALPGGHNRGKRYFAYLGFMGYWWSTSVYSSGSSWYRLLNPDYSEVFRAVYYMDYGFSVRCVKD